MSRDTLRRYDEFGNERPSITGHIIPRIHAPGANSDSPLSTLSHIPMARIPRVNLVGSGSVPYGPDDGHPPTPPPTDRGALSQQSRSRKRTQRSALIVDPLINEATLFRMALFRNPALGFQRCAFIIQKVPALVLMFVSSWVLWGRGMEQKRFGNESSGSIIAFVTGVFILGTILFGSLDHNNSYFRAKIMTNLRHIFVLIGGCASMIVLILAVSTIHPLNQEKKKTNPANYTTFMADGFNYQERINNQAVLIGASAFIIFLSVIALVLGIIGLMQMKNKLNAEKRRRRNVAAYENPVIQF
ncbi:unnamed protein product, partial [Mesorhabditis belari]|uniref:Uncharacterized protein n=1 Tax=Mesorhabditis belari TaxID=2138241 RepID=A0AAF3FBS6_9BILA